MSSDIVERVKTLPELRPKDLLFLKTDASFDKICSYLEGQGINSEQRKVLGYFEKRVKSRTFTPRDYEIISGLVDRYGASINKL